MSKLRQLNDHLIRIVRQIGRRTDVGKHRFWVRGYISNIIEVSGNTEPEVLLVIKRLLQRPGAFIDVGTNLGQTLGKVLNVDRDRAYIGFEPQIAACHFVNRFIRDNGLRNAKVLPIGLGSENRIRKFYSLGDADVSASLERSERHTDEAVIQIRNGDEVLQELGICQIAAIKVDVEGAELDVLNGLIRTLSTHRPPIIFEVLPNFEGSNRIPIDKDDADIRRKKADSILRFLKELDFDIYQLNEFGEEYHIDQLNIDDREKFLTNNFLARYKED